MALEYLESKKARTHVLQEVVSGGQFTSLGRLILLNLGLCLLLDTFS